MNENQPYIRLMVDIIDSGIWAKLSPAARTLYPVLLKFSDYTFKHVWPGTDTLLKLTGFKTKKSINEAKKELVKFGLLQISPGTGRTNTKYFFCFNYEGSKITPLGYKNARPRDAGNHLPGGQETPTYRDMAIPPNHINITIENKNINNTGARESRKKFKHEVQYSRDFQDSRIRDSENFGTFWDEFLSWAKSKIAERSMISLYNLSFEEDGDIVMLHGDLSEIQKQIINKYFKEKLPNKMIIYNQKRDEGARI
ncbi:MAG: helix-turn-helix domain-containing protein [Leptospiraceae bacterium]|nr:helix-turn-helix domain-containing protein [Leptospiraceae bacterium]